MTLKFVNKLWTKMKQIFCAHINKVWTRIKQTFRAQAHINKVWTIKQTFCIHKDKLWIFLYSQILGQNDGNLDIPFIDIQIYLYN